jgi:hypothetical protein
MRTRYILAAALLLCLAIGPGIFISNNHNEGKNDTPQAQLSQLTNDANALPPADGVAVQDNTVQDNTATTPPAPQPVAATYRKAAHRRTASRKTSPKEPEPRYFAMAPTPENTQDQGQVVETGYHQSKDYFGNKDVIKLEPKHKKHPFIMPPIGLQIGYAQSSFSDGYDKEPVGSIYAGVFYNLRISDHFNFQPGLNYVARGNKLEYSDDVQTTEKLKLHYLEVPANLVWLIGNPNNVRLMVGAGPYAALLLKAKDKYRSPGFSDGEDVIHPAQVYNTADVNRWDYGVNGFLGVQSPEGLFVKVGGEYGLSDVLKSPAPSFSNYSFLVTVGFAPDTKR